MNLKELKDLIETIASEAAIEEFELERSGFRLRIRKAAESLPSRVESLPRSGAELVAPMPTPTSAPAAAEPESAPEPDNFFYVTSPMVGTFYRASSPEAESFVKVGDFVERGSVLCIIEAMKLMNEIESEVAGEIVSIAVENGHPVEFGERLFAIRQR